MNKEYWQIVGGRRTGEGGLKLNISWKEVWVAATLQHFVAENTKNSTEICKEHFNSCDKDVLDRFKESFLSAVNPNVNKLPHI